jgi:uncharacterized protein YndB with AHSA1/START domain
MVGYVARVETVIDASRPHVWSILTTSGSHPEIMFGALIESDWKVGSPITWSGEWNGSSFEDHGEVVEFDDPERLVVTHFSPMSGEPDVPENYHRVSYVLSEEPSGTLVVLEQDNNPDTEAAEHSAQNWKAMLEGLKTVAERDA